MILTRILLQRPCLFHFAVLATLSLLVTLPAVAAEKPVDFVHEVQPIFKARCYDCHGPKLQESNYRLDSKQVALAEADFGDPPIVPGSSADSPLFSYIADGDAADIVMPPEDHGEPLTANEIDVIRRWIDQGAAWPDEAAGAEAGTIDSD
ncbi:MAG: c-type cytochrome domain-containing protein, partial [Pirellulales bacterium]